MALRLIYIVRFREALQAFAALEACIDNLSMAYGSNQ